jgi:hypothetical protein
MRLAGFVLWVVLCAPPEAYKKGVKLENAGDLVGALASFESIPDVARDFNARLHIASCKKKLGRMLEAEKDYEAIRTDPKADGATVDTAASDLEDLRSRIPKLVIKATPATRDVAVTVDGVESKLPATLSVNPGAHAVVASRAGDVVFKREVTLTESTQIEVLVDAPSPSAPVVVAPPRVEAPPAESSSSSQRTWGWIGVGTGIVFAGGALGAWMYSGSLASSYRDDCATGRCDKARETPIRTWETVSTVSLVAGVVATGVGVTLLLTAPREKQVSVTATTNGLYLVGSF